MILLCVSGNLVDMVEEVTYFVHEDFAEETFRSCKDVLNPATSGSVMNLLCGPWGLHLCTARRWFDYMGSTSNGYAPFNVAYNYSREVNNEWLRRNHTFLAGIGWKWQENYHRLRDTVY